MSVRNYGSQSVRAAVAVALGTIGMIVSAPLVLAADPDTTTVAKPASTEAAAPLEEITVTGSRIKRKNLESTSPLISIDSQQLEQRSGLNIESYLDQLPNFNPAQNPTTENGDVQPSAVNTVGISTISLRGFGPNRSLVLVDGHRTTPINALMVTDINSIPSSLIDHIEIITGGASATYGADAIGGVTNFIMKKNYEGAQIDVQDGITQAGDGNELRVSTLMGSKIADGKGNIIMGMEYYNRDAAYQKNRDFYTRSWTDPNSPQTNSNALFVQGYSGYDTAIAAAPSAASIATIFPARTAAGGSVYGAGSGGTIQNFFFNPNGSIWTQNGALSNSNYAGSTGSNGFGLVNEYDGTMLNTSATPPNEVQGLKYNDPTGTVSSPQERYSFFANGNFDITDQVQFYTNARFAQSKTTTQLDTGTTGIFGWDAEIPYNAATDSPINPALLNSTTSQATLQAIYNAFAANPTTNAYTNPGYLAPNTKGAQHPVPWQLAMMLDTRGAAGSVPGLAFLGPEFGGPITCQPQIAAANCSTAPSSWMLWYLPYSSTLHRSTVDTSTVWQIETGFKFPLMVGDWTGDVYYSRGQSTDYEGGYGNDSLQRFRAVLDSPNYGGGQSFTGNQNGADAGFGTSVPSTCTSGFYNTIFGGDVSPSQDCKNAIGATLQTETAMQQDIVEANFNGTILKLPAGDLSAAVGYQYRRDAGQFTPDGLQATNSFLDQTLGLYPLGSLNNEISARDGYAELLIPVIGDLPFLKKLNLDLGGRYSSYDATPNAATFKVSVDAKLTNSLGFRGGFNRATRAPNLGELYLSEQEYFAIGVNQYGDPCSLRSLAPFGAGGATADTAGPDAGKPANGLAAGQTAAGAASAYLICQAQMGSAATTQYYQNTAQSSGGSAFNWLNESGNSALRSETADTWTAGIVFDHLAESPWLSGFSGSVDWWQVNIKNAIELDSADYANYLCYGTVQVTTAAEAAAQAATQACQNVGRNTATGVQTTALLQYTNQANIGTAGIDVALNWQAQLADLGLTQIPGAILFSSQDTFMSYYRTKQSPANFDVTTDWKDSMGPNLAGTNGGAYGYRLNASIGYMLPAVSFSLRWRFLPSVNTVAHAQQEAIIANNAKVAAGGSGTILSYVPENSIAAPAWSAFDLSVAWTINKTFSMRAGINNLLDKSPAITGAVAGYPVGTNLNAVCSAAAAKQGCVNPTSYSLPNDGAGTTNTGFYDVYGRTFFVGAKAEF